MERTYILGNSEASKQLGIQHITIPNLANDNDIHNWIISELGGIDINKLIIEIGSNSVLSLKIALHIRLSPEELTVKSLLPILFVSNKTLNRIIIETTIWSHLFATKGMYFHLFDDIAKLNAEIQVIEGITPDEYKTGFLDIIKILPDEKTGRHSLANIWGAYAMDKAANTNALTGNVDFQKSRTKLYFKYVSAFNFNVSKLKPPFFKVKGKIPLGSPNTINSAGKKILLIDDEAGKGWELVLRKIFKSAQLFVINEKVQDYESLTTGSKQLIENNSFDLFLVDLRLNGIAEESTMETMNFSGMKVLQKIKSLNNGNQVIIFTASNKVWNQKALLEAGADGYYMKESPEYGFSDNFSLQNYNIFKNEVEQAFLLSYLRDVFKIHERCRSFILNDKPNRSNNNYHRLYDRTLAQLEIAFELLKQSNNPKYLNFSYLSYYQILEDYAKQSDNFEYDDQVGCSVNGKQIINKIDEEWELKFVDKDISAEDFSYFEIGTENKKYENPTTLAKISFILAYKFGKDNPFLKEWGRLNNLRNTVVAHGGKNTEVNITDLMCLLDIVELFFTNP